MSELQTITNKNGTTFKRRKRPVKYGRNVYVRLPEEDKAIFKMLVEKQNTTMGEKARELIKEYIKENI